MKINEVETKESAKIYSAYSAQAQDWIQIVKAFEANGFTHEEAFSCMQLIVSAWMSGGN